MTEEIQNLVASISLNQVIVSVLEQVGKVSIPTDRFLDAGKTDKELVIDYDEDGPSFILSLRDKNEG
jgi:hypothetical protein